MNTYGYLFWGYSLFWLGIAGYLLWMIRRQLATDRRLDELERRLDQAAPREH
jgi:CcmD family protein